jgi:hypothetical protein
MAYYKVQCRFVGVYGIYLLLSTMIAQPGPNDGDIPALFPRFPAHLFLYDCPDEDELGSVSSCLSINRSILDAWSCCVCSCNSSALSGSPVLPSTRPECRRIPKHRVVQSHPRNLSRLAMPTSYDQIAAKHTSSVAIDKSSRLIETRQLLGRSC